MFLKERQDRIIESLKAEGRVTVADLASRFDVSEDCIRKDLKQLDRQGALKRVYGGAISAAAPPERNVYKRLSTNTAEKEVIARKAYEQIADGQTIFLDVSTTNLALARLLSEGSKRCIVVSNMIDCLQTLAGNPALTVLGTGGNVNLELNGFVGALTLSTLDPILFDRAFIGALGIDLESNAVTTFDVDDGLVKQRVIGNATRRFLVADAHKFEARGSYRYARVDDFDGVITDSPSPKVRRALDGLGVACL